MNQAIRISGRAAERLRAGYTWVYRSDLLERPGSGVLAPGILAPGSLVDVQDGAARPLGTALFSTTSQIALRVVSRSVGQTREHYLEELAVRIRAALQRRQRIAPLAAGETTAQRLLFSEADALPGIVADRYGPLVITQLLTQGTAQDDVRRVLAQTLGEELRDTGEELTVWERPDARIRELESLPLPPTDPLWHTGKGEPLAETEFLLNGLRFGYDATAGQKTGAFLDQRLNYSAAASWVQASGQTGTALDVCTYQGGFVLHLAQVCDRVIGVDQSRGALEVAERNLGRNPTLRGAVDWVQADAFALLRALSDPAQAPVTARHMGLPERFNAIVLDPPAFTKTRRAAEGALRGYKELNLRALQLLEPGGTLITCSCSHHVSLPAFTGVVAEAAALAGRRVQLLETRTAAPDHPEVLTLPETRYLKCLICRVD